MSLRKMVRISRRHAFDRFFDPKKFEAAIPDSESEEVIVSSRHVKDARDYALHPVAYGKDCEVCERMKRLWKPEVSNGNQA